MGTSKITNILTLTSTLMLSVMGVVSTANAMPINPRLGKIEAQGVCLECEIAQQDAGLNKTRNSLIQLASVISPDGKDPRVYASRAGVGNPLAPIGIIRSAHPINVSPKGKKPDLELIQGTAFLVSPCLILTNNHVVFGQENIHPDYKTDNYDMVFEAGEKGTPNYESATATVVDRGEYEKEFTIDGDWTLLRLNQKNGSCMGARLGWFKIPLMSAPDIAAGNFSSAGFPSDRNLSKLTFQKSCSATPAQIRDDIDMATTCAQVPGSSGSPIFQIPTSGAPIAVGMASSSEDHTSVVHRAPDRKSQNYAVDLTIISSSIGGWIDEDVKGVVNPLESQHVAAVSR